VNSLHTVWDVCIIEKKLGTDPQTIAQDLLDGLPDSDRAAWVAVPIADRRATTDTVRAVTRLAHFSRFRAQDRVRPITYAAKGPVLTVRFLLDSDI